MSGKNFEQQVRETMGPWRLEPSGEVWGKLAADLQQRKRRRRAFYVFLLAGLLAGGALLRFGMDWNPNATRDIAQAEQKKSLPGKSNDTHQPGIKTDSSELVKVEQPVTGEPQVANQPSTPAAQESVDLTQLPANSGPRAASPGPGKERGELRQKLPAGDMDAARKPATAEHGSEGDPIAKPSPLARGIALASIPVILHDHIAYDKPFEPHGSGPLTAPALARTDSLSLASSEALTDKYTRKKKITFGIQGGVGRSAYTEGLNMSMAKAADLQSNPNTGGASGSPQPQVYDYRQDPALGWTLGAWMTLPISRRWSFTTGLSYLQYSTRTTVGPWAGDSVFGYFNGRTIQYSSTSYQPGNQEEHQNRYHLLQVPVEFAWQLNKGEKLPISWTLGITPGYLLSSNALVQDSSQAMYHHPDNQRRFQLGFRTGIMFRLMPASAHPLELGPVMQYQLNEVFTNAIQQNGHLYYLGLEARLPIFSLTKKQR